ncbi:MAG: efflux RND transporter periplasmic adaptor subunit [Burkholderiales bacterium]|nr:efflux RND transporter periplasmic adaptor subunit [Burkholderiales bacterium]
MSPSFAARAVVAGFAVSGLFLLSSCSEHVPSLAPVRDDSSKIIVQDDALKVGDRVLAHLKVVEVQPVTEGGEVRAPARSAFEDNALIGVLPPAAGRVQQVLVREGDTVKAGAPLLVLRSTEAARLRSDEAQADEALRLARIEAGRQRTMLERGVGIESEKIAAEAREREAARALARVRYDLSFMGVGSVDEITVRAPSAGVVVSRRVTPGAMVRADDEALLELGVANRLWIVAEVFEEDLPLVHPGATAKVTIGSGARPLSGKVVRVSPIVDPKVRRAVVPIALDAVPPDLRVGAFATAKISTQASGGVIVPASAVIIKDGARSVVYVEREAGVFERRKVHVGDPSNGFVNILDGLRHGERIVAKGAILLDGAGDQLL